MHVPVFVPYGLPLELIHSRLFGWLEMDELPGDLPRDQMDKMVTAWADEPNGIG